MIIALVPAHNEEKVIGNALQGLYDQTAGIDKVVVVLDNCTDGTEVVAKEWQVDTFTTKNNKDKKAGALNQALSYLLEWMDDDDYILVTDADSVLDSSFVQAAVDALKEDPELGGVGGVFRGQAGGGFVGHLQRNEYARYARDIRRLRGKCLVLTGTAAMFPVRTLRGIRDARLSGMLPAGNGLGGVYDTTVLTEDNELSFALMHLGYKIYCPPGCTLTTEIMPTWRQLWNQRLRWKRGAIENCVQYGLTRVTARYWGRQIFTMLGVLVSTLYLFSLVYFGLTSGLNVAPMWMAASVVFVVERVVTVRDRGWKKMALSATMYELIYDYFIQACQAKAYVDALLGRTRKW